MVIGEEITYWPGNLLFFEDCINAHLSGMASKNILYLSFQLYVWTDLGCGDDGRNIVFAQIVAKSIITAINS